MPIEPSSILPLVQELSSLTKDYTAVNGFSDNATQERFVQAAEKLAIAARESEENVYFTATRIAQNAAIRCAISLGVFDIIPMHDGNVSVSEIASKTGADKLLIIRIM